MKHENDWETIIQRHIDGQSTEEEAAALSEQIVNNTDVRSEYLKAARIHGALGDEFLSVDLEPVSPELPQTKGLRPFAWPQQLAAALIAGALVGLLGAGVVWAVGTPRSEASLLPIAHGNFESMAGPVEIGFPARFGHWSGDPAEVIETADGNHQLRFLESANVTGKPNGGASACNVFQLVDLSSLQQQWDAGHPETQVTLELSARFRREAAPTDTEVPRIKATCTIHLYDADPGTIGQGWPDVARDALALGNKAIQLEPGEESGTISASCILAPEATLALISMNVNTMTGTKTPIQLGGYFADDVQLTAIKQPVLPVRFVK